MATSNVLWFTPADGSQLLAFQQYLVRAKVPYEAVLFRSIAKICPAARPVGLKRGHSANLEHREAAMVAFAYEVYSNKPRLIVLNDDVMLSFFLNSKSATCWNYRGSTYRYNDIPVIVINDIQKTIFSGMPHLPWALLFDIRKLGRLYHNATRPQPAFRWTLCNTKEQLDALRRACERSMLIAADTETVGDTISVAGYCTVGNNGQVHSWVIPFTSGILDANTLDEATEEYAWQTIRQIHNLNIPFTMQNGMYDQAFFFTHRCPIPYWFFDVAVMFRAIWASAPRNLGFIASVLFDDFQFWKDENKTDGDKKAERIRFTKESLAAYWEYNAKDTYYTALATLWLADTMPEWARVNYVDMITQVIGPSMEMSYTPWPVHKERQNAFVEAWKKESEQALADLRVMTADPEFNPFSSQQVITLLFHTLGAYMPFKKRAAKGKAQRSEYSADEKILRLVQTQHPLIARFIDKIWEVKKPHNNAAKYGPTLALVDDQYFIATVDAVGTETRRYAAKRHHLRIGTNPQNFPPEVRSMLVAPDGYCILSVDYAQSDAYYTAFTLQDPIMIEELTGDKDSHCMLASEFFSKPYEDIFRGWKAKEPWVVHSTKGVRQNTKRIRYGCNYLMMGQTLYMTMGHEAVVATAEAMDHSDAPTWPVKRCIEFCGSLVTRYWNRYYVAKRNFDKLCEQVAAQGSIYTDPWGQTRVFFGNVSQDAGAQREFASQIGQGGTAGCANKALKALTYWPKRKPGQYYILPMVHDELNFLLRLDCLHLIDPIINMIQQPCTIHGQTFTVPVEASVGFAWKAGQLDWPCTVEEMHAKAAKLEKQND